MGINYLQQLVCCQFGPGRRMGALDCKRSISLLTFKSLRVILTPHYEKDLSTAREKEA